MAPVGQAERQARMAMSVVAEPGDADACGLIREHSAEALVATLREGRTGGSAKVAGWAARMALVDLDSIVAKACEVGARYLCPGDDEWPNRVDDLVRVEGAVGERRGGAPFGLWARGSADVSALTAQSVAIVGSRACTMYGEHVASGLSLECSERGFTVVSGGAYGVDAASHRGAIAGNRPTVAVLAGGVDNLYPAGNSSLLGSLTRDGLLLSEAPPGGKPSRSRFLVRNRLIAALGLGTVVVEAALRSGALNTARWASDLDRAVMGVPGPVTSRASAGVHELLRQPGSVLVTDASEIIEHISPIGEGLADRKAGVTTALDALGRLARQVLDAVPGGSSASAESIATVSGLPPQEVADQLDSLHAVGLVVRLGDGWSISPS